MNSEESIIKFLFKSKEHFLKNRDLLEIPKNVIPEKYPCIMNYVFAVGIRGPYLRYNFNYETDFKNK